MTTSPAEILRQVFAASRELLQPGVYQFSLTSAEGAVTTVLRARMADGECVIDEHEAAHAGADIDVTLSADDFQRCASARASLIDVYSARRLGLTGDVGLSVSLLQAFQQWQGIASDATEPAERRRRSVAPRVPAAAFAESEVLRTWIAPYYLRPEVIEARRATALAAPIASHAVLDDFFAPSAFAELAKHHEHLEFVPDDRGLNFDSSVVFAERGKHFGSDLFFSPDWHEYIGFITGAELASPGTSMIRLRRHDAHAHGFWPHSDQVNDQLGRRAAFVVAYFNKGWRLEDGAVFQIWRPLPDDDGDGAGLHRWNDYIDRPLSFLESGEDLCLEVPVGSLGFRRKRLLLVEQVLPEHNRILMCDLSSESVIHSVTPSHGRVRSGFVQWIY
jgi:hypothetical protein